MILIGAMDQTAIHLTQLIECEVLKAQRFKELEKFQLIVGMKIPIGNTFVVKVACMIL